MRALGYRSFGGPDKMELLDLPTPSVSGPEEILVQVKSFALNQHDCIVSRGYSRLLETVTYVHSPLPKFCIRTALGYPLLSEEITPA